MLKATSNSSVIYDHRGDVMSEYHVSPSDNVITSDAWKKWYSDSDNKYFRTS